MTSDTTHLRKSEIDAFGAGLLVGFSVLLGFNQALVKLVNEGMAPLFQSGLRSACAFVPVLLYAMYRKRNLSLRDGSLPLGVINGLLFTGEFGLLFTALDFTTVARASLFFYMMPVWVALGAHFWIPGERLHRGKVFGLTLAVCGVLCAFAGDLGAAPPNAWVGDLLALWAGIFWAGIALLSRGSRLAEISAEQNLLYQLGVSALLLLAVAPWIEPLWRDPTTLTYIAFSFQALVVVSIGFLVWFWILSIYPVSNMASFGLLAPIFGIFFGWMVFDDALTPTFLVAIALAGAGIVLVNRTAQVDA
ncbi:MAG: DMT family transporter [Pseudomonadota bacterium]